MTIWPGLLLAPLLALLQQSLSLSLVTPSCSHNSVLAMHLVAAATLLLNLLFTALAARTWQRSRRVDIAAPSTPRAPARQQLLAGAAAAVGLLATVASAAMWWPVWVLSPCTA